MVEEDKNTNTAKQPIHCPSCGRSDCTIDYRWTDESDSFPGYNVVHCDTCALAFGYPMPTDEELKNLYDSLEYHDVDRAVGNFLEMDDTEIAGKIDLERAFINKYRAWIPGRSRIFDIGAGWGTLMRALQDCGHTVAGLECSKVAGNFASQRLGLDVSSAPVEEIGTIEGTGFDVVIMRHTLEHFRNPRSVLKGANAKLVPGGVIVIEVPDYGSMDRRLYGKDWPAFGPCHLWYFKQASLARLLEAAGFEVIAFKRFMSEKCFPKHQSSTFQNVCRKIVVRLGGARIFSGRSIGVVARKI